MIFALVVGLGALALSTFLWTISYPLVAWQLSLWLAPTTPTAREVTGQHIRSRAHASESPVSSRKALLVCVCAAEGSRAWYTCFSCVGGYAPLRGF